MYAYFTVEVYNKIMTLDYQNAKNHYTAFNIGSSKYIVQQICKYTSIFQEFVY